MLSPFVYTQETRVLFYLNISCFTLGMLLYHIVEVGCS